MTNSTETQGSPGRVFGLYKTMPYDEFIEKYAVGTKGLLVARIDSRRYAGDSDDDYLIKRCWINVDDKSGVGAGNICCHHLVAYLETETENGIDGSSEIFCIPLPRDTELRNQIIDLIKKNPDFWRSD